MVRRQNVRIRRDDDVVTEVQRRKSTTEADDERDDTEVRVFDFIFLPAIIAWVTFLSLERIYGLL